MKKKTVYGLKLRLNDNEGWCCPSWFKTKKQRDTAASFNRIIGGIRTYSFDEKKTLEEIAAIMGVTRERVRQIEEMAMAKISERTPYVLIRGRV